MTVIRALCLILTFPPIFLTGSWVHANTLPQGNEKVFIGQHFLYNRTFNGLQGEPFNGLRIWGAEGTAWFEIEPEKGKFDFHRFDSHVAEAKSRGFDVIHTLGQTPRWASARPDEKGNFGPGSAAEPADMADWSQYIRTVATRFKGRISAYEVMNEPRIAEAVKPWSPGFFSGSAAKLAELTKIAAFEIKKADPAAKVVCPAMDGVDGLKRLDYFLGTGAGNYCDVIGYHYYLRSHTIKELRYLIAETHRIKARHNLAHVPIWDTETGVLVAESGYNLKPKSTNGPLSRVFTSDDAARLAAQVLVVSHILGVQRTYWFAHDSSSMGSTDKNKRLNKLNQFGQSLATLKNWLSGRRLSDCVETERDVFCEVYDQNYKVGAISWGLSREASQWLKAGYSRVEELNGQPADLESSAPTALIPSRANDVIFLACPCINSARSIKK